MNDIDSLKLALRKKMINNRDSIIPAIAKSAGIIIEKKFLNSDYYKNCDIILIYVSKGNEADTFFLINKALQDGKKVAVPKVISKGIMYFYYITSIEQLSPGSMGILEPDSDLCALLDKKDVKINDIFVCPGVAFDKEGSRLGYGGGFYDRYLRMFNNKKIAFSYEIQILDSIPMGEYDEKVDVIFTESNIYGRI
ncbi:MAG: 5-formyltetrahydrofolate cyclo-ligase [Lachnospiraceae bacterium]|nr:5-formyltetrahydrofolate cyclo-ligase [Lachnospiraceae bacterium]